MEITSGSFELKYYAGGCKSQFNVEAVQINNSNLTPAY